MLGGSISVHSLMWEEALNCKKTSLISLIALEVLNRHLYQLIPSSFIYYMMRINRVGAREREF